MLGITSRAVVRMERRCGAECGGGAVWDHGCGWDPKLSKFFCRNLVSAAARAPTLEWRMQECCDPDVEAVAFKSLCRRKGQVVASVHPTIRAEDMYSIDTHTSHKACHGLSAVCALLMSGQVWGTAEVE